MPFSLPQLREMLLCGLNGEILDPGYLLYQDAVRESAGFIKRHLETALVLRGDDPTWRFWPFVLDEAKGKGLFLEFGVYKGHSLKFFAKRRPDVEFHGFDSFLGLPENWSGTPSPKGFYSLEKGEAPDFAEFPNIKIVSGWFEDTLQKFIERKLAPCGSVSFLHMDANLYKPTKFVLESLMPYIGPGTIIVFDDFLGYPGYAMHEFKAFFEVIDPNFPYEWIAFQHMRAALRIL